MVKALDFQSRGPGFKTTGWLQGQSFLVLRLRIVKSKLFRLSGSVALRHLNPTHKKGPSIFFKDPVTGFFG